MLFIFFKPLRRLYSPCSQLLFPVQDIPVSFWLLVCILLHSVNYQMAPLHIFGVVFEMIKAFLAVIYYQGLEDQITGYNYL